VYKSANKFFKEFDSKNGFPFTGWYSNGERERKHEEVDAVVERDAWDQKSLKRLVLYNFWALKGMRAQVRLVQMLVKFWDSNTEAFNLDGKPLRIEVEDIYFIIVFSHQGEVVNLKVWGVGVSMNIEDYIATHCVAGIEKVESHLSIRVIENLSLKIFVCILTWIIGSTLLH
jgi:hypothetical protein